VPPGVLHQSPQDPSEKSAHLSVLSQTFVFPSHPRREDVGRQGMEEGHELPRQPLIALGTGEDPIVMHLLTHLSPPIA